MIKIYINITKTLGDEFYFLNAKEWRDFNDKSLVLGTKITVVCPKANYEKVTVKVSQSLEDTKFKNGSKLRFDGLEGTVYDNNGFCNVSLKADKVVAL